MTAHRLLKGNPVRARRSAVESTRTNTSRVSLVVAAGRTRSSAEMLRARPASSALSPNSVRDVTASDFSVADVPTALTRGPRTPSQEVS